MRHTSCLQVTTCATGREALDFLHGHSSRAQIVLKDSEPGQCDAARLLRRLQEAGLAEVPVVGECSRRCLARRAQRIWATSGRCISAAYLCRRAAHTPGPSPLLHPPIAAVMSSQDSHDAVERCLAAGAADYLLKPLRANELKTLWTRLRRAGAGGGDAAAPGPADGSRQGSEETRM